VECAQFWSTWDCPGKFRSGPRHGAHPSRRGAEPGAATTHNSLPLSSSKDGLGSSVPHGYSAPQPWQQYYWANQDRLVPREELIRKAFELALRFDIAGPLSPYYSSPVPPPGPQLLAP
jgi:hypothetical protein